MLIYKTGDILKATENIICHQVNVDGVMGGGLALQIANAYPEVERLYKNFCEYCNNDYERLKGRVYEIEVENKYTIGNCFTQKPNFDTDYEAIKQVFRGYMIECKNQNTTIAVPFKYGCGIAKGDWNIVSKIFEDLSNEYGIDISVYKLEDYKKEGK